MLVDKDKYRVGGPYAKYVLVVMIVVYTFNLIDRQILSILSEELKGDLGITDAQLGFLYGTSFAAFYAIFGLPLGRLADLWIRKSLIAIGLVFWSAMTMLSGTAGGIVSLALYRFGVGAGEASATPATYSLLSDWFPPNRRASVLATYSTGAYIGMGVSLGLGGLIVDFWKNAYPDTALAPFGLESWQVTFMMVGFPGIILAFLVYAMHEPERGLSEGIKSAKHPHPFRETWYELMSIVPPFSIYSLSKNRDGGGHAVAVNLLAAAVIIALSVGLVNATSDVAQWTVLGIAVYCLFSWAQSLSFRDPPAFDLIFKSKALRYANIAYPACTVITYSFSFWVAPYFLRTFDAGIAEVGVVLGATLAICGGIGVATGGYMADFLRGRRADLHVYMAIVSACFTSVAALVLLNTDDLKTAYIANAVLQFFGVFWSGAGSSIVTELVLPRMRATSSAFYIAVGSIIGLSLGPYTVGRLSDWYTASGMDASDALRTSLQSILIIYVVIILFSVLARRHFIADYNSRQARAELAGEPPA